MHTTVATWEPGAGWSEALPQVTCRPGHTFALAFLDPACDPARPLADLQETLPGAAVVACSTAGQILGGRVDPAPIVAAVVTFDHARVRSGFVRKDAGPSQDLGATLAAQLRHDDEPVAGVLVLGGGLRINGSALVAGLTSGMPPGTPVFGGLAADGDRFEHTWVYCNGQEGEECVAGLAFLGDLDFRHGSEGGWDGFGPVRTITRSAGNVLYELDGQPALALYRQYLGDRAGDLPGSALLFPLTVSSPDGTTRVVRTILAVDETDQSMTFAGDVPEGWSARLMWTSVESLIEGASAAAEDSVQPGAGLALAVSCVGRRLVLGDLTDEELESVQEALGGTPLIGFYSYGEITPVEGNCALHNQTMTVTTVRERA
jgi:hypothetical protein